MRIVAAGAETLLGWFHFVYVAKGRIYPFRCRPAPSSKAKLSKGMEVSSRKHTFLMGVDLGCLGKWQTNAFLLLFKMSWTLSIVLSGTDKERIAMLDLLKTSAFGSVHKSRFHA